MGEAVRHNLLVRDVADRQDQDVQQHTAGQAEAIELARKAVGCDGLGALLGRGR
ncbi:MAG TPA: hypothetical protein VHW06_16590 [Streptosporangiaceae bacterium]|jgi:hypothetical protein|nr:hypothetical protein [Streptosporangiaceae bacterium]